MYAYGNAPSASEIEVTVFGPGFGESIAVHLGGGNWLLVDSCYAPSTKIPAAINYLQNIGVPLDSVKAIVASHWHDDHVRGMTATVNACPNASLHISSVFNNKEGLAFLTAFGGGNMPSLTKGSKELYGAARAAKEKTFSHQRSIIWQHKTLHTKGVTVVAFSPTKDATNYSMARLASYLPPVNHPIQHAPPELAPNMEAIVLCIDFVEDSILLGSDLEHHGSYGWEGIVFDDWCRSYPKASAYKVAHHGSITGEHPGIWSELVQQQPLTVLTPFIYGSNNLPKDTDIQRIKGNSAEFYMSSNGTKKPQIPTDVLKQMALLGKNIAPVNTGFGVVRSRKQFGTKSWNVELFGQAAKM